MFIVLLFSLSVFPISWDHQSHLFREMSITLDYPIYSLAISVGDDMELDEHQTQPNSNDIVLSVE